MKSFSLNNCGKILVILLCVVTVISVVFVLIIGSGARRIFLFEQQNNDNLTAEIRYLKKTATKDDMQNYVDELLLGPITPQCRPVFPLGTHVESLFLRDRTLYVNLSEEAIQLKEGKASEPLVATEIFKKNIFTNFRNVDIIKLYIVGNEVYVVKASES